MKFYRYFLKSIWLLIFVMLFVLRGQAQTLDRQLRMADLLKNSGNYEQALALYLNSYQSGQKNFLIINNIQDCYEKLKQYSDLIDFLKGLIKKNPQNLEYRVKLGRAFYLNGQPEKAFALWDSLMAKYSTNIYLYRSLGANLIQLRLYDRAIKVYQEAIKNIPRQKSLYREIAMIYRAKLNYAQALKNYLNYFVAFPSQYGYVRSQIIAMTSDTTAIVPMISVLKEYLKSHKTPLEINELLADLYLRQKNFSAAFNVYFSMYKKTSEVNFLLRFANKSSEAQAYDFSVKALQILLNEAKSKKPIFQLELARNYYNWAQELSAKGRKKEAFKKVKKAAAFADALIKANPRSGYWWAACDLKGDMALRYYHDVDQAINWYGKVVNARIDSRYKDRTRLKLAKCYLIKGQLQKSWQTLNRIRSGMYQNIAAFKKAELLFYQGQLSKAKSAFQKLSQTFAPDDSLENNVLSRLLLLQHSSQDSAILVQYGQAEMLVKQNKLSDAVRVFGALVDKHSDLSAQCGEKAVHLLIKLGKFEQAVRLIHKIETDYPDYVNNDRLYFLLATALKKRQQWKEAFRTYQTLIIKFPESFYQEKARENALFIRNRYLKGQVE